MAASIAESFGQSRAAEWQLSVAGTTDAELVARSLAGDSTAFDTLVERHRRNVYHVCYRFVGNHEDASDLAQDVFLRAFRALRRFKGQSSVGTWLYRIAVNVSLNRVSVKTPQSEPIDARQHVDTRSDAPGEQMLRDERAARVRAALAKLPRKQRAAVILRMYH